MKVLAIVASARKTGNSEILAKEMLAALPESVEKKLLRLDELKIEPCKACYACLPSGCGCVINDDFSSFLQEVRQADAIILSAPVYFLGMHTRLKLICDRLISVLNEAKDYTGRRCVVAVPYGVPDWEGYGVEATVSFARFLHLEVVGVLPVRAANPGEVVRPEVLARARELAGLLACVAPGEFKTRQAVNEKDIACGVCGSGLLRISGSGGARCALCGAAGALSTQSGESGAVFECWWEISDHPRFSPAGMTEHAERLERIKADFLARRQELAELRKPYKT